MECELKWSVLKFNIQLFAIVLRNIWAFGQSSELMLWHSCKCHDIWRNPPHRAKCVLAEDKRTEGPQPIQDLDEDYVFAL